MDQEKINMRRWAHCMAIMLCIATLPAGAAFAAAQEGLSPIPTAETGLADQTDVAVTVYNNDLALVRDERRVTLPLGEHHLKFMDVAEQIRPETVSLRSVRAPGSIRIFEQNYEYDLMSPSKLMEKYVGKPVRLINFSKEIGFETVDAELLSLHAGPIYRVNDEIYLGHPGTVVLPEIPENLIAEPSLIWLLDNRREDQQIEVSYLTRGMAWRADYVITLERDGTSLDLDGWVTLTNGSGAQYTNARLKLVAGDVNVVPQARLKRAYDLRAPMAMAEGLGMTQEAFAEYHLYSLPRRTTIKHNQSKQVSLLTASGVRTDKLYELRGDQSYHVSRWDRMPDLKVAVFLMFDNEKKNQLGIPLPAGVMRVYQEDSEAMLQFAGEDRIDHTPKDEEVRLRLGSAFDIAAERKQTDFTRHASNIYESAYEIKIRNHKEDDVTVDIIEPMPADWRILEKSHNYVKRDAHTAVFSVLVPVDGEAVVTYRVWVRH